MIAHTLIHNSNIYPMMTLLVLSCSCFMLANYGSSKLNYKINIITMNIIVKGFIVCYGLLIIPLTQLIPISINMMGPSLIMSIGLFFMFILMEKTIHKLQWRYKLSTSSHHIQPQHNNAFSNKSSVQTMSLSSISHRHPIGATRQHDQTEQAIKNIMFNSPWYLFLIIALLEEIIFRGFLVNIAFKVDSFVITVLLLCFFNFIFGISHLMMGWGQFFFKITF